MRRLIKSGLWPAALIVSVIASSNPVVSPAAHAQTSVTSFTQMGMHIPQAKDGVWPDVPIGSIRLWDTGVSWREINTAPGVYDWSTLDRVVDLANSKGSAVLYAFGNTPAWAAEPGCLAAQGGAIKGAGANCPPADFSTFSTFAAAIAKRYGTRIESYELWNEGNIGTFWRGTVKQLFDMTNDGAKAIKRENPKALIASVSVTTRLDTSRYKFLAEYAQLLKDANWPIDAFAIHSYPAGSFEACSWTMQRINRTDDIGACDFRIQEGGAKGGWHAAMLHLQERENDLIFFRSDLYQKFKMPFDKQIWDTELNYGLAGPGDVPGQQFSEAEQVTLINYSYVQSEKYGINRTYWFAWGPKDLTGVVQFGVTTDFGSKTAQAYARYWEWVKAGMIAPAGPKTWVVEGFGPNPTIGYAVVQTMYPGVLPRGKYASYITVKPVPGLSSATGFIRYQWPAVGPCKQIPPNQAVETETLAQAPYIQSPVPIPGC